MEEKENNLVQITVAKKVQQDKFAITGFILGLIPTLFFGAFDLVSPIALNPFQIWLYADLFRSCYGEFCTEVTLAGWLVLFIYFVGIGILLSYLIRRLYKKWGGRVAPYYTALAVIFLVLTPALTFLHASIVEYIPRAPLSLRCASVAFSEEGESFSGNALNDGRIICLGEIARQKRDVSWCQRAYDDFSKTVCVTSLAIATGDINVCDVLDPEMGERTVCTNLFNDQQSKASDDGQGEELFPVYTPSYIPPEHRLEKISLYGYHSKDDSPSTFVFEMSFPLLVPSENIIPAPGDFPYTMKQARAWKDFGEVCPDEGFEVGFGGRYDTARLPCVQIGETSKGEPIYKSEYPSEYQRKFFAPVLSTRIGETMIVFEGWRDVPYVSGDLDEIKKILDSLEPLSTSEIKDIFPDWMK